MHGNYKFEPHEYWANVSETARDFVRACLTVDSKQRPTAEQLLKHKWLADLKPHFVPDPNSATGEPTDLLPHVRKQFDARRTCECSPCHLLWGWIIDLCMRFHPISPPSNPECSSRSTVLCRTQAGLVEGSAGRDAQRIQEGRRRCMSHCLICQCQLLSNDIVHKCRNTSETRRPPPSPIPTRHHRRPRRSRVTRAANSWHSSCPGPLPLPPPLREPPLREPQLGPTHPHWVRRPGPRRLRTLIPPRGARQVARTTQRTCRRPLRGRVSRIIDAMRGPGSATSDFSIFIPAYGRPMFRGRDHL